MCEQCNLAAELRATQPASDTVLRTAAEIPPEAHAGVIDNCRTVTGDAITDQVALNLVLNLAAALGITPNPDAAAREEFQIMDRRNGTIMDIEAVPPVVRTTARMLMCVRAADLLAARDIYQAFSTSYPDQVTRFLLSVMKDIYANTRPDQ